MWRCNGWSVMKYSEPIFPLLFLQTAIQIIISAKFTWLINVYVVFFKVDLNNYKIQKTVSEFRENVT